MYKKHILTLKLFYFILFAFSNLSYSQESATQTVAGIVVDNATKEPIENVLVELLNYMPLKTTSTNERGQFILQNIPVGKHRLLVTSDAYDILIVPEVEVTAGQQVSLNVSLEKTAVLLNEIVVKTKKISKSTKDSPINHMALTGIRSFTIEEVQRYPASYEDPARLVVKFAGASRFNTETGIVIRGHNPHTVLWQLEGMPISNPNHMFFKEGPTGYFPIFNIYLLQNSDFLNGAFPAEYGNAMSGVLDLSLRTGNNRHVEGSVKASFNALEAFVEGPLNPNGTASFVIGGRYSILHLITGTSLIPNTSDLSFKVNRRTSRNGEFNAWGIGGMSSTSTKISALDTNDRGAQFLNDYTYKKIYGLLGFSYKHQLNNKKGYVNTILGSNYNSENFSSFTDSTVIVKNANSRTIQTTLYSYLHYVFNPKHQLRTGLNVSHYYLDFISVDYSKYTRFRDYNGHTFSLQAYAQWLFTISKKLKSNIGVNAMYLFLNNTYAISPRFALSWEISYSHRLSFSYTWNYQMQSWETYLNLSTRPNHYGQMVDKDLDFNRSHCFTIAYDWLIENNWRLKAEIYGQYHSNIAINTYQPAISLVNHSATQNLLEETHFVSNGLGYTYGVELTVEKFFSEGYYGMVTAAYFDTKYLSSDNVWRNTETNNRMVANLLFGKEFKIGKQKNNAFFMDISYAVKLGNYSTPVDLVASMAAEQQVLDWSNAYSVQLPAFHNVDLRVGFSFNHKRIPVSHRIFVEVSNLLNQQVNYRQVYNPYTQTVANHQYPGLIPNLSYRINFGIKKKKEKNV